MMVTEKSYPRNVVVAFAALLINALLFIVLPYFMTGKKIPAPMASVSNGFRVVELSRMSKHKSELLPSPQINEVRPPEKQKTAAPDQLETNLEEVETMPVDVPSEPLPFVIKPLLNSGPPVTLPKSEPAAPPSAPAPIAESATPVAAPAPAPAANPGVYDQSEVDQVPAATVKIPPEYPYRARKLQITGEVRVKFLVDVGGQVRDIRIVGANPPDVFDDSVINAISTWRFTPGLRRGKPVVTRVTTTIVFELKGGS
jgi:protein TonB